MLNIQKKKEDDHTRKIIFVCLSIQENDLSQQNECKEKRGIRLSINDEIDR